METSQASTMESIAPSGKSTPNCGANSCAIKASTAFLLISNSTPPMSASSSPNRELKIHMGTAVRCRHSRSISVFKTPERFMAPSW